MKLIFYWPLVALILIFSIPQFCYGQKQIIRVDASRYNYSVSNISDHHIKIEISGWGKNYNRTLSPLGEPNSIAEFNGFYSKREMGSKRINCLYDADTYSYDVKGTEEIRKRKIQDLDAAKIRIENEIYSDLSFSLAIEAGRNSGIGLLEGPAEFFHKLKNWVEKIENFGRILSQEFYNKSDVIDLLADELEGSVKEAIEKSLANYIDKAFNLKEETSKEVVKAILIAGKKLEKLESIYHDIKVGLYSEYDNKLLYFNSLLNDDTFENVHSYTAKAAFVTKPSFRTKSPNLILTLEPLSYGSDINDYWTSPKETVLKDADGDDESEFHDGLWNNTLGASFGYSISPEMYVSQNFYSRIYIGAAYDNTAYNLKTGNQYSNNFFSKRPDDVDTFSVSRPITLNHSRISINAVWRFFIGNNLFIDLQGGVSKMQGNISLKNSELSEGFEWAVAKISYTDRTTTPFGGVRFGIGKNNNHKGTHLVGGIQFFEINHQLPSEYKITRIAENEPAHIVGDTKWKHRIHVGLSISL